MSRWCRPFWCRLLRVARGISNVRINFYFCYLTFRCWVDWSHSCVTPPHPIFPFLLTSGMIRGLPPGAFLTSVSTASTPMSKTLCAFSTANEFHLLLKPYTNSFPPKFHWKPVEDSNLCTSYPPALRLDLDTDCCLYALSNHSSGLGILHAKDSTSPKSSLPPA